jgi:hypothetical protein
VSRKRAHPSACGKTSCFKTSLNAPSSYDSKNEFSLDNPSQLSSGPLPFTFFKLISVTEAAYVLKIFQVHVAFYSQHIIHGFVQSKHPQETYGTDYANSCLSFDTSQQNQAVCVQFDVFWLRENRGLIFRFYAQGCHVTSMPTSKQR